MNSSRHPAGRGARVVIEDGFFARLPCEAAFALHNTPGHTEGRLGSISGPAMASSDTATITVRGKGGHGALPQLAVDPVVVASSIVMALQTIVPRNLPPLDMGTITAGAFHSGTTYD